ncbi:ATP-binding protein [Roseivirga sp. BDSF3-8]|uniref:ATP-binding protein n=1 Tax=Roseivirga sp. BDSF3-8 TaxID=3241598 RepID=UPI003531DD19
MEELNTNVRGGDLQTCDKEPIHIPGATQRYGLLLVMDPDTFQILQTSDTVHEILGRSPEALLDTSLADLIGQDRLDEIIAEIEREKLPLANPFLNNINPLSFTIDVGGEPLDFSGIIHRSNGGVVLEIEKGRNENNISFPHFYELSRKSLLKFQGAETMEDLTGIAAREVKALTGFDRVMIYQFDDEWNGDVIAEARNSYAPGYLGLHYPASDIPSQARALYLRNWLRYIPDTTYQPAKIIPQTTPLTQGQPLDLSNTMLRSVSPIHIEYLHNMGVKATLTISLIKDGKLWGLIACHHLSEHYVPYHVRIAAEYIGQILSLQLSLKEKSDTQVVESRLRSIHSAILESVSRQQDFMAGMHRVKSELLQLTDALAFILVSEGEVLCHGPVPDNQAVIEIINLVKARVTDENFLFYTNHLSALLPEAQKYKNIASGLMAFTITKSTDTYVIWLRPEVVQLVNWGGQPDKIEIREEDGKVRLHPRKSFEKWQEEVRMKSIPWGDKNIYFAKELRNALKDYFLFKAEKIREQKDELENLNLQLQQEVKQRKETQHKLEHYMDELKRSNKELEQFAYITSHDLQEPLRATSSFSRLLAKRYADQLDERGRRYIDFIVDGTARQQQLIEDILEFSRSGSRKLEPEPLSVCKMVDRLKMSLSHAISREGARIKCDVPFTMKGDHTLLNQLFQNLISNAMKYRRQDANPVVKIGGTENDTHWELFVKDNGIGIEEKYFDKVFVIFRRLHTVQEYPGTGVGLSICKRIVEKHGGKIWVKSDLNEGTTFYFTIAKDL